MVLGEMFQMALRFVPDPRRYDFLVRVALSTNPFYNAAAFHLALGGGPSTDKVWSEGCALRWPILIYNVFTKLWGERNTTLGDGCTAPGTAAFVQAQGRSSV